MTNTISAPLTTISSILDQITYLYRIPDMKKGKHVLSFDEAARQKKGNVFERIKNQASAGAFGDVKNALTKTYGRDVRLGKKDFEALVNEFNETQKILFGKMIGQMLLDAQEQGDQRASEALRSYAALWEEVTVQKESGEIAQSSISGVKHRLGRIISPNGRGKVA